VQNPTGTIMPLARRHELLSLSREFGVPIFEDECYADLVWEGSRPPALYALDPAQVVHIGSFSKSLAPALRIGYLVAQWPVLSQIIGTKTDAGSGALEQMVVAEYLRDNFDTHVTELTAALHGKLETIVDALAQEFGTAVEMFVPKGGIFLWLKLPDHVDVRTFAQAALQQGLAFNPGPNGPAIRKARRATSACASRCRRRRTSAPALPSSPASRSSTPACRSVAPTALALNRSRGVIPWSTSLPSSPPSPACGRRSWRRSGPTCRPCTRGRLRRVRPRRRRRRLAGEVRRRHLRGG
jgi:hypothetical protein